MNLGHLRRWQRRALFVGLGVLLLWLLGWAAVPSLARWQIEKQGTQLLGRVVKLEGVAFRPWSMALVVRGLRIGQAGDTDALLEPQLKVSEIEINAALQSLVFWAPVADAIVLRDPQLLLTHRGQGRFDIDDVMDRLRGSDSAGSGSSGSGFPRLSLFNIQIVGGGARFLDEPKSVSHTLADVRLDIPFLSNIGGKRDVTTHPRLAFTLNGAAFDTDAETAPFAKDRHTQAHFQIKRLEAAIANGKKFEYPVSWGIDMQSEHERYLTEEVVGRPVVVMNYPKGIKAFYMRLNDDNKTVAAMDVLAPGIGEIIGGSQREERLDVLDARMRESHLDPADYGWYRDLRRYGSVPHAGFGLGFERTISYATGLTNIRDCIPFPRATGTCEF